jgi:hypothetical protein
MAQEPIQIHDPIKFIVTPSPSVPSTPIRQQRSNEINDVAAISLLSDFPDTYRQTDYNKMITLLSSAMLLVSYYRGRNPAKKRVQQLGKQMPRIIHMQEELQINAFNHWLVKKYFSLEDPELDLAELKHQVEQLYQSVNPDSQVSAWLLQLFPNFIKSDKKYKKPKLDAEYFVVRRDPKEFPDICNFDNKEEESSLIEACMAEHIVHHIIDMFEDFKKRYKSGFFISTNPPMLTLCKKIQTSLKELLDKKFESKDEFKRAIVSAITDNAVIAGILPNLYLDIIEITRAIKKCINFKKTAPVVTKDNSRANAKLPLLQFCAALLSATSYYQNNGLVRPAAGRNPKRRWLKQAKEIEKLVQKTLVLYQNNYSQGAALFDALQEKVDNIARNIRGRWFFGSGSRLAGSLEKILRSAATEPDPDLLGPQQPQATLPEIFDASTFTNAHTQHFANQQLLQTIAKKLLQYKKVVSRRSFISTNIQKLERMENIENAVNNLFRSTLERQKTIIGEKSLPEHLLDLIIGGNEDSMNHEPGFFRSGVYGKVLYEVETYLKEIQPVDNRQIAQRPRPLG